VLTIHQLKVFVTVLDAGSVRVAAQRLVVTQPAVSSSLAALEREVGAQLFSRSGRGIEPTDAGRVMERYARQMLGLVDEAISAVGGEHEEGRGTIRIGAVSAAADHLVAALLAKVKDRLPHVGIALEIGNRDRVWPLLADRTVDVVLGGQTPSTGDFVSVATRRHELVLVAKPGAVWAQRMGEATWLLREPGSGTRSAIEEVIAALGIAPPTMTLGSPTAVRAAAEAGLGIGLFPHEAVVDALRVRSLSVLHSAATPLRRTWNVVVRRGEPLPVPARHFVETIVEEGGGFERTR